MEEEFDFGTPKEVMKENFYKTMMFFVPDRLNVLDNLRSFTVGK